MRSEDTPTDAVAALYQGLYDPRPTVPSQPGEPVRLLNPGFTGDDPTGLRFAQLEVA